MFILKGSDAALTSQLLEPFGKHEIVLWNIELVLVGELD